jgi:hypothetical protein
MTLNFRFWPCSAGLDFGFLALALAAGFAAQGVRGAESSPLAPYPSCEDVLARFADAGVDVAALQRLSKTADRMGRMLFDLASDPEKVLGPVFQKLRDQLTAETQQFVHSQGQQQQAEEAMNHVWASHADLVVDKTDRTKLSAAGQRVMERYGHLVNELGAKASPATLQDAIDYVKSMTPAPRPTKQPSKSALHAPAMAEEAAGKKTDLKERFRKGMTDGSKFGIVELMDERLRLRKQAT